MRADIVPGSKFPDYELPDHTGTRRHLSELQGKDPVALVLARGSFCPREHRQHVWMVEMEPEVVLSYTRFITVSTDPVLGCLEWRSRLGAHWASFPTKNGWYGVTWRSQSTPIRCASVRSHTRSCWNRGCGCTRFTSVTGIGAGRPRKRSARTFERCRCVAIRTGT